MNKTPTEKPCETAHKAASQSVRQKLGLSISLLIAFAVTSFTAAFAQAPSAMEEMRAGALAYKFSDYAGAVEHFKAALAINPELTQARLFLATAYAQQYIAGDESAANVAMAEQAIDTFKQVLNDDPSELERYKSVVPIASLSFNLKRFDEARDYYGKAIELKPDDARNYFTIAVSIGPKPTGHGQRCAAK